MSFSPWLEALLRDRRRPLVAVLILLASASVVMALRSGDQDPERILGGTLVLAAFAVGPLMVSGVVSDDLRTGAILLWLQKPVSPLGLYLRRTALSLAAAAGIVVTLLALGTLALWMAGGHAVAPLGLLRLAPFMVSCSVLAGLVTFAFSGLGVRKDGTVTLVYLLVAVPGALILELSGPSSVAALLRSLGWVALFPLNELQLFHRWLLAEASGLPAAALLRVGVYGAAWLGFGILATWRTTRRPFGGAD